MESDQILYASPLSNYDLISSKIQQTSQPSLHRGTTIKSKKLENQLQTETQQILKQQKKARRKNNNITIKGEDLDIQDIQQPLERKLISEITDGNLKGKKTSTNVGHTTLYHEYECTIYAGPNTKKALKYDPEENKSVQVNLPITKILKEMRKTVYTFLDPEFPPQFSSLIMDVQDMKDTKKIEKFKEYEWYRITDIYPNQNISVYYEGISPLDIIQGSLGDCYFLAAISTLAEKNQRIKRLFIVNNYNKEGVYGVQICESGEWRDIMVDDYFPTKKEKDKKTLLPAFTRANGPEMWVLLLEKVWAKINGGYDRIIGGLSTEVLHDFTGGPTLCFYTTPDKIKTDKLWQILCAATEKGYAMCCGKVGHLTGNDKELEGKLECGLVSRHAYSLIKTVLIKVPGKSKKSKSEEIKLCVVRNPWGKFEWNGEWSDQDKRWTPQLRKQVGFEISEDGLFCMGFKEFIYYFGRIDLCIIRDKFLYSSYKVSLETDEDYSVDLTILTEGTYYISINQPNLRDWRLKDGKVYPMLELAIKDEDDNEIASVKDKNKEVWVEVQLEEGRYTIQGKVTHPSKRQNKDIVFSSYGVDYTIFGEIYQEEDEDESDDDDEDDEDSDDDDEDSEVDDSEDDDDDEEEEEENDESSDDSDEDDSDEDEDEDEDDDSEEEEEESDSE